MNTAPEGTETPQEVKDLATEQVALPRIALIGVFGSQTQPGALIRNPNGKISRVGVGDAAAGGIVAAIGDDKIVIAKRDGSTVLSLPQA